jgi:branched-chain amino acid transport system substrate-binding protein
MKSENETLIIFVIIYVSVFASSMWLFDRAEENQGRQQVQIGVISPSDELFPKYNYIAKLAQEKINAYFNQSGLNQRFNFNVTNAAGNPENAYKITKNYHEEGVNLIVGYGWNSHLNASLEYAMENDMVLVSPSSTSPLLAQQDRCFRLLPDDKREAKAIATMITNFGIDNIIILQRKGSWGKNLAEIFLWEYQANGGEVIDWISYTTKPTPDINESLDRATKKVLDTVKHRGKDKVGVLFIALDEASTVLLEAKKSSVLLNVTWFGTDATTLDQAILNNAGRIASRVALLGPVNTHIYNEDYQEVNKLYLKEFGEPLDFCTANVYDGCWLLALSVSEAESKNSNDVSEVFGDVAYKHYGITGPLDININGDRSWIRYYFYGYYEINGNVLCLRAGSYTRLEKYGQQGSSISHSPFDVLYDNFPYYIWEKQYESK